MSYDGKLIWLIQDFARKLMEAKSGFKICIQSSPFFTNRRGVQFCNEVVSRKIFYSDYSIFCTYIHVMQATNCVREYT